MYLFRKITITITIITIITIIAIITIAIIKIYVIIITILLRVRLLLLSLLLLWCCFFPDTSRRVQLQGTGNRASRWHNATTRTTWVENHRDRFSFPRATFCPLGATPVDRRFFEIGVFPAPPGHARGRQRAAAQPAWRPRRVFSTQNA